MAGNGAVGGGWAVTREAVVANCTRTSLVGLGRLDGAKSYLGARVDGYGTDLDVGSEEEERAKDDAGFVAGETGVG